MSGDMHNKYCDQHIAEHKQCNHHSYDKHGHCTFDVWAPDRHSSINNLAFSAYAVRQQQIEDIINALAKAVDPNDFELQCSIYQTLNFDSDTLTIDEVEYIEREAARRRCR